MSPERPTILYLDDDPDYLEAMGALLEAAGYHMLAAGTAEEGLRAFQEGHPQLILVDLMMEEVDSGTSFVKEVRARGSKAPIYMLSSVGDSLSEMADVSALGLAGVFQKPVDRDGLLAVLESKVGNGITP